MRDKYSPGPSYIPFQGALRNLDEAIQNHPCVYDGRGAYSEDAPYHVRYALELKAFFEAKSKSSKLTDTDYHDMEESLRLITDAVLDDDLAEGRYDFVREKLKNQREEFDIFRETHLNDSMSVLAENMESEEGVFWDSLRGNKSKVGEEILKYNYFLEKSYIYERVLFKLQQVLTEREAVKNPTEQDKKWLSIAKLTIKHNQEAYQIAFDEKNAEEINELSSELEELQSGIQSDVLEYSVELAKLKDDLKIMKKSAGLGQDSTLTVEQEKLVSEISHQIEDLKFRNKISPSELTHGLTLVRSFLKDPNDTRNIDELNQYAEKLPADMHLKYYLKALVITAVVTTLLAGFIVGCIYFPPLNALVKPIVGQVSVFCSQLIMEVPSMHAMVAPIVSAGEETAFVLPAIAGGGTVPVWSLALGAVDGAVISFAVLKTKLILENAENTKLAQEIESKKQSYEQALDDEFDDDDELDDDDEFDGEREHLRQMIESRKKPAPSLSSSDETDNVISSDSGDESDISVENKSGNGLRAAKHKNEVRHKNNPSTLDKLFFSKSSKKPNAKVKSHDDEKDNTDQPVSTPKKTR
ncbi:MAG: hypothetical protein P1U74_03575 [Legionellaceae bacterium]|nr:hypothetical protein [Legionellaceae bacterium]